MSGSSVPFSIALTAGGLAVVNPCAFPLLPAFLSFYLGVDEQRLPAAPTRALQGLLVGALVATGFLTVFAVVGLPLSFGLSTIANAVPWLGLATGAALAGTGMLALGGVSVHLPSRVRQRPRAQRGRSLGAMFLFGVKGGGLGETRCVEGWRARAHHFPVERSNPRPSLPRAIRTNGLTDEGWAGR